MCDRCRFMISFVIDYIFFLLICNRIRHFYQKSILDSFEIFFAEISKKFWKIKFEIFELGFEKFRKKKFEIKKKISKSLFRNFKISKQ